MPVHYHWTLLDHAQAQGFFIAGMFHKLRNKTRKFVGWITASHNNELQVDDGGVVVELQQAYSDCSLQ